MTNLWLRLLLWNLTQSPTNVSFIVWTEYVYSSFMSYLWLIIGQFLMFLVLKQVGRITEQMFSVDSWTIFMDSFGSMVGMEFCSGLWDRRNLPFAHQRQLYHNTKETPQESKHKSFLLWLDCWATDLTRVLLFQKCSRMFAYRESVIGNGFGKSLKISFSC